MIRTSVACRACSAGWYGEPDDRCPRCHGPVVVTDRYRVVDLTVTPGPSTTRSG